jgi:hypothetical protein
VTGADLAAALAAVAAVHDDASGSGSNGDGGSSSGGDVSAAVARISGGALARGLQDPRRLDVPGGRHDGPLAVGAAAGMAAAAGVLGLVTVGELQRALQSTKG